MAGLLTGDDAVAAELRRWASEPFGWAEANCVLSVLDYVERVTGRRLAMRPALSGRRSARRFVQAAGGMVAMAGRAMASLDCPRTDDPRRGDVGVIDMGGMLVAAIRTGRLWAARGRRDVVFAASPALAAWRVECPRQ
ncbi:DUF6950 family protein [Sphingomonas silueang]|uniref:DUF6950 family protein n=1 Tax=Sphingomonas silueang TaxID=3156617 RepID=UPI0032B3FE66